MKLNYTSICFYCGEIYQSNRSTSKYCSPSHNSLYNENGSAICSVYPNAQGIYVDYLSTLSILYFGDGNQSQWSKEYEKSFCEKHYQYDGPLPSGDELLLVGSFLIRRSSFIIGQGGRYSFKPFIFLTKKEKTATKILKPSIKMANCF